MDIAVALGGGGSKGNAHIGVLKVLKREGFNIKAIAGTSAGGLAAAVFAAGMPPEEIEDKMASYDLSKFYGREAGDPPSLLGTTGIRKAINELLGTKTFDDLEIPCAVTSVDLNSNNEVIISDGSVIEGLLATIAFPGILPAFHRGEYRLVDGAVMNPVPVSVVRSLAPNIPIVASVLLPPPERWAELPRHNYFSPLKILDRFTRLRVAQAFEIFLESVEIYGRMLTELRLELDAPDVIIRPDVGHIGLFDQVDIREVVKLGEKAAEDKLMAIRKAAGWRGKVKRLRRKWNNPQVNIVSDKQFE